MGAILGADFVGAYLQGSFAVGDFDRHSDVDFVVVVAAEIGSAQLPALQGMHGHIYDLENGWAQHLEGSYFPRSILRRLDQRERPLWYLDHGSRALVRSDHCNTAVVRSVLHRFGIGLAGPPVASLLDPVPAGVLRAEMWQTLNGWGQEILENPEPYRNRFYQTFIVLNYCRMLHDLHRGAPGSKRAGAEWAKANLDPRWRDLIDRAWLGRPDPARSVRQPADAEDFERTLRFLRYVMEQSREFEPGG